MQGARVVHGHEDPRHRQFRVEAVPDLGDRVVEQREPAETEEFAFHRDEHRVGAGQRVDGEQPERGLAIDEYVVVAVEQRVEHASERLLASDFGDELNLGGRQVDVAGQKIEVLDACVDEDVVGGDPRVDENVVDGHVEVVVGDAETGRQRTLGVEIDEEHAATAFGE